MKIAVASPPFPNSIADALMWLEKLTKEAVALNAEIICFPESFIPGYPGMNDLKPSATDLQSALDKVCQIAVQNSIAVIAPMDWPTEKGLLNVAQVISASGEILGYQSKNQLDPSEDHLWTPGTERSVFEVNGVKLGITICHEGFRYPESVRWSAQHDAKIVFHPHFTGSNEKGILPKTWGSMENPYYEKAIMMRALENTVFFASSNYASHYPESASTIIGPDGTLIAHEAYGKVGVIVADLDITQATGLIAKRFKNALYR